METPSIEERKQASVQAAIKYVVAGEKAVFVPTDRAKSYWPVEEHVMRIESMRPLAERGALALEKNGFVLVKHRSAVRNFYDADEVKRVYYPEVAALVKRLNGAAKVAVFGEIIRSDAPGTGEGRLPAYGAHVDYGEQTIRRLAADIMGEAEAARWLAHRFVLMNLWRPLKPVEKTPLALCDAATVARADLNDSEIKGGLNDPNRPSMYGFNLSYSPRHRWYYAPRMQPFEVLAFKLFDSDSSRAQWTGHTAFDDPTSDPSAPARESIETRTISFFSE
jgi:hypothetical protein